MGTSPGGQRWSGQPDPLNHAVRRNILRRLHGNRRGRRLGDLSTEMCLPLSVVGYHLGVLSSQGLVIKLERGPENGVLYQSTVAGDHELIALLKATAKEDEDLRAASAHCRCGQRPSR